MISSFSALVRIKFSLNENLEMSFNNLDLFPLAFSSACDYSADNYERIKQEVLNNPTKILAELQIKEPASFEMICKVVSHDYMNLGKFEGHHSLDFSDVRTYLIDQEESWT